MSDDNSVSPAYSPDAVDVDLESIGYRYDPSVDMSGYIPLEKRLVVSSSPAECDSRSVQGVLVDLPKRSFKPGSFVGLNKRRQRGRVYQRALSGVKRNRALGRYMRFLTLTTPVGYDSKRLMRDFNSLCKRLEHVHLDFDRFRAFKPEYVAVTTDEGNGVIHAIFFGSAVSRRSRQRTLDCDWSRVHVRKRKGGFPVNPKHDLGYIPFAWVKRVWAEIVGGDPNNQHVYIERVYGSVARIAGYLCQYVSGQHELRHYSCTDHWVYRGFVGDWNGIFAPKIAELFRIGDPDPEALDAVYREWDNRICTQFLCS